MGPPEVLTQSKFIRVGRMRSTWACFDHISLIRTRNRTPFLFLKKIFYGLLVLQGIFYQNFKKFSNRLNQSSKFQFTQNSLKQSEFGEFGLVSIISPSSKLEIMHSLFCWIPYSLKNSLTKFENFLSIGSTGWKLA